MKRCLLLFIFWLSVLGGSLLGSTRGVILLFIAGYTLIALEHKTGINKTAIALILCIALWTLYGYTAKL